MAVGQLGRAPGEPGRVGRELGEERAEGGRRCVCWQGGALRGHASGGHLLSTGSFWAQHLMLTLFISAKLFLDKFLEQIIFRTLDKWRASVFSKSFSSEKRFIPINMHYFSYKILQKVLWIKESPLM